MIQVPLTREQFTALGAKLESEHGIALTGDEGKLSKMGVTAGYKFADGLLSVNIVDKPFFVTEDYCEAELKKVLGAV